MLVVLYPELANFLDSINTNAGSNQTHLGEGMENQSEVTIVDVKMPFGSMVVFMVKAAIAAIPAVIILAIIFALLGAVFSGIFAGFV